MKDLLRILTAGSVDDGKSTLIGRLLFDRDLVFEDHLEALRKASKKAWSSDELDFSLLCDGLKAEREQGITIDVAYRYFSTEKRKFIIADCPGHEQYTRNMATGASTAELAIILVDAQNGVLPQTKRHSFIATLLGIRHLVIAINKMDLVGYDQSVYDNIKANYADFAAKLEVNDVHFIPISALKGDNIVHRSANMAWYNGDPLLDYLESVHIASDRNFIDFRMPIQYVIRDGDSRAYAGTVLSGTVHPGEEIAILPSGQKTRVRSIKTFGGNIEEAFPPLSIALEINDDIDTSRGDVFVRSNNLPDISCDIEAMVVWMNEIPLKQDIQYTIKHGPSYNVCSVREIRYKYDINTLKRKESSLLDINEIGRVVISSNKPLSFDSYSRNRGTGCFVLIDRVSNQTVGAGMIMDRLTLDCHKRRPLAGSLKSAGFCLWLTGLSGAGKTTIAKAIEQEFKSLDIKCERLDGDTLRDSLNKDLGFSKQDRATNIDRAMFIAKLLARNGIAAVASFISPYQEMRDNGRKTINNFIEVFVKCPIDECEKRDPKGLYKKARAGEIDQFTGIDDVYEEPRSPDIVLETNIMTVDECVDKLYEFLIDRGLLLL